MGCASSKQKRCRHCNALSSPVRRSYSIHGDHLPQSRDDSYHLVALKSSTLGSLKIDPSYQITNHVEKVMVADVGDHKMCNGSNGVIENGVKEFAMGLIEAKTWSNMIEEKIPKVVPKTPIRTPPGEPETINAWELMEGLEDISPFRSPIHMRSFSFDAVRTPVHAPADRLKSRFLENGVVSPKPMWLQMADGDGLDSEAVVGFDPEVISTFRKSLEELSPDHPFHLQSLDNQERLSMAGQDSLPMEASENKIANGTDHEYWPRGKEKVIIYFTSLRGVRKTYEDCCHVRVILKSIGVRIDERDVSMHSGFKEELRELLGDGACGGGLPRVFVGSKYIGGTEEIRCMHEEGQLEKFLENCKMVDDGSCGKGNSGACEACGDIRFVPCERCSGSCKIYCDGTSEEDAEEEGDEYGFQRCPDCNENGLIRCPICCY
ncbi:uncharacterized protein At3g28850 [Eucalyptus grandis]|uniref:uncharacterized protein At3g28850 n=1 Tax=Eucalyptus grandis TaxID=71139 RepID=UPI000525697F|nr:uncharacterized protein At3g28850 [Eucalyptus grandis]